MTIGYKYRITVLTSRLIRMEYQEDYNFVDAPTQMVVNRDFPRVEYTTNHKDGDLIIETEHLVFKYDGKEFSTDGLTIEVKETGETWHYSIVYGNSDRNLYGAARTLDNADGGICLEDGIFGEKGFAVIDDSESAQLVNGEFVPREGKGKDLYFFGYGKNYREGLKDFFALCGKSPLLPRYALGNWWSRYYAYSAEEYNELLDKLEEENIPLSVAVLDMDWHVTQVDPKYGTGWTGYTWNKELFPDYKAFLKNLKERGLATTLNLHPADGIRGFEAQYEKMAKRLGMDPRDERPIEFDFANAEFRKAYFELVMNPYEEDGVDFWWIDWQQGTGEENAVDPLFLLNHYHYHDSNRAGRRGMVFSRYAGVGSHRYPVGFSGDTVSSWKSLDFQPYFTAISSNIGYGWWSHDIGGHMMGDKNEERLIRWIQFGVFSPVMRLHSSASPFFNKEPWNVSEPYRRVMGEFMRLRHQLIPYIYSMNYKMYAEGQMLLEPMYYRINDNKAAYEVRNEYFFGDNLLVGAITEGTNKGLRRAKTNMLIPDGIWFDIFTGTRYTSGRRNLYRTIDSIPVLIKEGGIVPLSLNEGNDVSNPKHIRLLIGAGADGEFELYEDDGVTNNYENGEFVTTKILTHYDAEAKITKITIKGVEGLLSLIPQKRVYDIQIVGLEGEQVCYTSPEIPVQEDYICEIKGAVKEKNDVKEGAFKILEYGWMDILMKERTYDAVRTCETEEQLKQWLAGANIDLAVKDAIAELIS
ncbi:Alpha-glucosidase, glycosyl hydrolase family GH31 [Pseudobutyrivibrio sp. YE44]|uniref:glycoside hydrolase family 31 protein n=1 Tax=Pseudobutyrivibrio sp. YE44 TaxID=1520802 RepID=UPI00088D9E3A|nr:glycoside hydrolase family 31 protein [Pseudobutyrivibrio sp. YE44]SDB19964.1 Alpha-glucosidase, glycosyl hydrolase family GH31 [Pseudobutyrivibrio sp. YE44]